MSKYAILTLTQGYTLEKFDGEIIEILSKNLYSDEHEHTWSIECLVELPSDQKKGIQYEKISD